MVIRDVGQCLLVGPFIHLGGFILQAQCPQPVGNEVLNFQVVGRVVSCSYLVTHDGVEL